MEETVSLTSAASVQQEVKAAPLFLLHLFVTAK